jgi:ABC-type transport system involved in multi-copper enzyme maturation permease subunit
MTVLPVVAREMGVLARRKSMYWSRWVTAILALLVMLWLLVVSAAQLSFAELGSSIFLILSSLCFTFTVLIGMQATADCLAEEKREGTLGLLFLTDLKGFDIIAGKLAASSLQAALALIGVIPMISLALLLGGVTLRQFGKVALVLANTMFLSLAVGALVSSFSRNERKAMMGTFVALFAIVLGPWMVGFAFRGYLGFPESLLAASPLYDFSVVHARPGPVLGTPLYFWHSMLGLHAFAWVLLFVAAWVLPKSINELPSRRFRRIREFADNFVYGRLEARKKHRAELLDRNAFLWLASRERAKPRYAWAVIAFFIALYAWIAFQFDNMFFDLAVSGAIMFLVHLVFKIWAASEVCSRLIQDRRSGALELLLSTPLAIQEIAEGQSLALRRIFLKPIVALLLMEVVLLFSSFNAPRQTNNAEHILLYIVLFGTFLMDLWALKWVGLWLSLTGKSIERVLLATISRVLLLPWFIYAAAAGFFGEKIILMQGGVDANSVVFGWGVVSVVISIALAVAARENFLTRFRDLAANRFETIVEPEPIKMVEERKPQAKRRLGPALLEIYKRKPLVASLVLFLVFLVLLLAGRGEYWSYRRGREIAVIESQGLPVTQSQASRYHPAPPAEQDAFAMLRQAGTPNQRTFNIGSRQRRAATPQETNAARLAETEYLVSANQAQLSAFRRLPEYQGAYLDPLAQDLWQQQFNHAGYAAMGEADLLVALRNPGPVPLDRIEKTIRALLAHARLLRRQPVVIAQSASSESLRRLLLGLEEVLARDVLTEEVLRRLLKEALSLDDPTALTRTLVLQRAFFIEPPPNYWAMGMMVMRPPATGFSFSRVLDNMGSRDKAFVEVLDDYVTALDLAKAPYPRRIDQAISYDPWRMQRIQSLFGSFGGGGPTPIGYIPDAFWSDAAFAANLHLVQTALALELYQGRHAAFPPNLGALVPEFLSAVPVDPYTGQPLSMLRKSDELIVYSVGLDQQDDTANSGTKTRSTGTDVTFSFR